MDTKESSTLTNIIKPQLVIPVHYGDIVGDLSLKNDFIKNLDNDILYKILI